MAGWSEGKVAQGCGISRFLLYHGWRGAKRWEELCRLHTELVVLLILWDVEGILVEPQELTKTKYSNGSAINRKIYPFPTMGVMTMNDERCKEPYC